MNTRVKILFLLAAALALAWMAYTAMGPGGARQDSLRRQLDRLLEQNRRLSEKNRLLLLEIDALKKRNDYIERLARDRLGLVAPGELVLRLPDQPDPTASPDGDAGPAPAADRQAPRRGEKGR
ncbi:MAG: hypothetical protein DRI34_10815 [Deltaproteobacteria bacterium]|nr:MAG: hypothetical protein DRI34_10815 [Deltaproteobacteria bacterium]